MPTVRLGAAHQSIGDVIATDPVGPSSVAPVHDGGYLSDNGSPSECGLLCADLLELPPGEKSTHSAARTCAKTLVEVIQRRSRGQRGADRLEAQSVSKVTCRLAGTDQQGGVP